MCMSIHIYEWQGLYTLQAGLDITISCHSLSTGSIRVYHHVYRCRFRRLFSHSWETLDDCIRFLLDSHCSPLSSTLLRLSLLVCCSVSQLWLPDMSTDKEIRSRSTILIHLASSLCVWHLFLPGFHCIWSSSRPRLLWAWALPWEIRGVGGLHTSYVESLNF